MLTMVRNLPSGYRLSNDYVISAIEDEGPFSTTYLARDAALDVDVTIKEYFPRDYSSRAEDLSVVPHSKEAEQVFAWGRKRYFAEAQSLARLKSVGIPNVFRVLDHNNTVYLILERIDGSSIREWPKILGRRPSQKELDAVAEVLTDALTAVHSEGMIHRDVSSESIIIRKSNNLPIIINFSSTRLITTHVTTPITISGYAPMEAYSGDDSKFGPWSDIYGLCAVLYEVITGQLPPEAPHRFLDDTYVPCAEQTESGAYRRSFLRAIDWGLSSRPMDRPQSVQEWRSMLLPLSSAQLQSSLQGERQGSKIFISYRRADSNHIAGRIYDQLETKFGSDELFFDVDSIPLGVKFREHIRRSMLECGVLLAVIGRRWSVADNGSGFLARLFTRRKGEDFVRIELELAIEYGVPIIPILVDGATLPNRELLPKSLAGLPDLNATSVRGGVDFRKDMTRIINAIDIIRGPRGAEGIGLRASPPGRPAG